MQPKEPFALIGVKPNSSFFHNTMIIFILSLLILVLIMIYVADNRPYNKVVKLCDIENVVKPGTQMYDNIMGMDEKDRMVYIAAMGKVLKDVDHISRMRQILKTVFTTLAIGFIVEYIIHGDTAKMVSIVGKTSLTAALTTLV